MNSRTIVLTLAVCLLGIGLIITVTSLFISSSSETISEDAAYEILENQGYSSITVEDKTGFLANDGWCASGERALLHASARNPVGNYTDLVLCRNLTSRTVSIRFVLPKEQ